MCVYSVKHLLIPLMFHFAIEQALNMLVMSLKVTEGEERGGESS